MLAVLVLGTWLTSSYRTLPGPRPANAPDTVFSSARAMAHLVEIARRPHPPGSPAHAQVRGYVVERLRDLGIEPEVQTATSMRGRGTTVRAATIRNIVARIPGRASTGEVVLTAHYDGREIARAAGDDGSGVVSILEIARALQAGPPLLNDVVMVIADAEELGLLGSRAFVEEHPAMADVQAVISLEMRGSGGPSIMFETGPENGWIIRALKASGARPFTNSLSYEVYKRLPNDTDFTPFREAGAQGLNFAAIGRASNYHQHYDSPENLSEATLQQHGESALRVARHLAGTPLGAVTAPDVAFLSLPVLGIVAYDLGLALPLAAVLLIAALLVLLPVRRTARRWGGILVGLALGAASVGATAGIGHALMSWLPRFHPEFESLHGSAFHQEGWYVMVLAAAALAVTTLLLGVARRRFTAAELTWGALVLPLLAMGFVALRFPAAAMNLQFPLSAALLACLLLVVPRKGRVSHLLWALVAVLCLPVLAVLVPVVEFIWAGLSFRAAAALGAVIALTVLLLLPALDRLREPNAWWAPLTALLLGAAFLAVGIRSATPDPRWPAPSTLAYLHDHGTGESLWITDDSQEPVDAPALAWAEARTGASFTETRTLERYGFGQREARVTGAPEPSIRKPEVWTVSDSAVGDVRYVRLAVRSAVGAELIQFRFPEAGGTHLTALNGRALPIQDRPTLVEHWGAPDPVVLLDLELAVGTTLELDVVEHLLRPQELVGTEPFQRPADLAPDITWLSDRAILRTPSPALEIQEGPPPFPLDPVDETLGTAAGSEPGTPQPADTVAADTLRQDTSVADSVVADTLPPDTVAPDTVPPDTLARRREVR